MGTRYSGSEVRFDGIRDNNMNDGESLKVALPNTLLFFYLNSVSVIAKSLFFKYTFDILSVKPFPCCLNIQIKFLWMMLSTNQFK